jgi:hypothetical protein
MTCRRGCLYGSRAKYLHFNIFMERGYARRHSHQYTLITVVTVCSFCFMLHNIPGSSCSYCLTAHPTAMALNQPHLELLSHFFRHQPIDLANFHPPPRDWQSRIAPDTLSTPTRKDRARTASAQPLQLPFLRPTAHLCRRRIVPISRRLNYGRRDTGSDSEHRPCALRILCGTHRPCQRCVMPKLAVLDMIVSHFQKP